MKIVNISEKQLKIAYEVAKQSFLARLSIPLDAESRLTLMAASSPFAENKNIHHWIKIEVSFYDEEKGRYMRSGIYSVDNYSDETYSSYDAFRAKFDKVFSVDGVKKKVNEKWRRYTGSEEDIKFNLIQEGEENVT